MDAVEAPPTTSRPTLFHLLCGMGVIVVVCATILILLAVNQTRLLRAAQTDADYHLATTLYAGRIDDEFQLMRSSTDDFSKGRPTTSNATAYTQSLRRSLHLIDESLDQIRSLQREYEDPIYDPLVQRAFEQGDRLREAIEDLDPAAFVSASAILLRIDRVRLRVNQLSELHNKSYLAQDVSAQQAAGWRRFYVTAIVVLAVGFLLTMLLFRQSVHVLRDRQRVIGRLAESEERFRQLADNIHEMFWITSADGEELHFASRAYEKIWQRPVEGAYRNPREWFDAIHPDDRDRVGEAFFKLASTRGYDERFRIVRPDGSIRWIHDRGFPITNLKGEVFRIAGIAEDITEQVNSQEAVRQSDDRFRGLLESGPDGVIIIDGEGRITLVNAQIERLFGYSRDEMMGRPVEMLIPEHLRLRHVQHRRAFIDNPESRPMGTGLELHGQRKDGSTFDLDLSLAPLKTNEGLYVMGIVRDVTEQKEAAEALSRSEERFRRMASTIDAVFWLAGPDRRDILYVSPAHERIFGYSCEDHLENPSTFLRVVHPDDRGRLVRRMDEPLNEDADSIEYRIFNRNGDLRWIRTREHLIKGDDGAVRGIAGLTEDVTLQKRGEQRQHRMMAELDHRVKNNLASVLSLADQTMRHSSSLNEFSSSFLGRVIAMARTHEALAQTKWTGVDIGRAASITLATYLMQGDTRIRLAGEPVQLPADAAIPLCMTLHELSTNAAKYGALSAPEGRVDLSWSADNGRVNLTWVETGGPTVVKPETPGTGTGLINGFICYELQGEIEMDYRPEGLRCSMSMPLDRNVRA